MNNYVILTDSACDLTPDHLSKLGVKVLPLSFLVVSSGKEYLNYDIGSKEFYSMMRDGDVIKTSAINVSNFKDFFEAELKNGFDILYLGFSSGLSTTYNSACIAADDLKEKYPDRKIICVDTLSASAGFGLLLNLTVEKKNSSATIEEAAEYAKSLIPNLCHWFTVDDLVYLKRGGRISPTVAFVGGLLGIKPILHMDDEGRLVNITKVRGRKASIEALAEKFGELGINKQNPVWLCHADCEDDAKALSNIIKKKYGVTVGHIADIGPVIGAHAGPHTIAVFFIGNHR